MTPINVLYLMEGFELGGAERRFVRMALAIDRQHFRLTVGTLREKGPLRDDMQATNTPIVDFTRRSRFDLSPVLHLREYLRNEGINVVHSMHWLSGLTAVLAASTLPHVALVGSTVGMVYGTSREHRFRLWGDRLTWRRLDRMTVNSQALLDYLAGCGFPRDKLSLVLNGVEVPPPARIPEARRETRATWKLPGEGLLVGIVARLTPVKDHSTFLLAAERVHAQMPEVQFVIVGDGPERSQLEELVTSLGLDNIVHFTGAVASSDLVLPALDVAVLSSRHEGMPNALLEAAAWGIPLVATAVGGVPEIVRDGQTGLLAPAGAPDTLSERILELLRDPGLRSSMGARARELVIDKYSVATMIQRYQLIYEQVLAQRVPSRGAKS